VRQSCRRGQLSNVYAAFGAEATRGGKRDAERQASEARESQSKNAERGADSAEETATLAAERIPR